MPCGFRELDNITADLGIEAWGTDTEAAFTKAAEGLAGLMSDVPGLSQPHTRRIRVAAESLPALLVGFLNEIVFLQETEGFLPGSVTCLKITGTSLQADLAGALFDPGAHTLDSHIKAATYHGLEVDQAAGRVTIKVIFDV